MASLPILYFTYADPDRNLDNLKRERKEHHDLMIKRFLQSQFGFFQYVDFTRDNLKFGFEEFIDKLAVFHFSGHAAMGEMKLQDGSVFIDGIAAQMKAVLGKNPLPELVLVFLNGCCTGSLVNDLLEAGVPVVIGTSAPVEDNKAADFSVDFYKHLMTDKTINQAFEYAESRLTMVTKTITICRGLGYEPDKKNEPLWGLFYKENKKNLLDWKLSDLPEVQNVDATEYEINSIIRGATYNFLHKSNVSRIVGLETRRLNGEDIRSDINSTLMNCYPGPISFRMARLLNVENDNEEKTFDELLKIHLNNIYDVYQSLTELLFMIMISQLWDNCLSINTANQLKPILPVDYRKISERLELIKDFFVTPREQRRYFDYIPKIRAIREIFDEASIQYFLEELEDLKVAMEQDADFKSSYNYFTSLRDVLKDQQYSSFSPDEWKSYCKEGEEALSNFFNAISFCVRYDFGILKNIELMLPRFESKPSYLYKLLKIPKSGNTKYYQSNTNLSGFTSVRSIVMLRSETFDKQDVQKVSGLINLSPFMLDLNVTDQKADKGYLLIYSHYDKETGNYLYEEALRSKGREYIKSNDPIFEEIHKTFDTFFEVLFNEKITA